MLALSVVKVIFILASVIWQSKDLFDRSNSFYSLESQQRSISKPLTSPHLYFFRKNSNKLCITQREGRVVWWEETAEECNARCSA